jgi:hypothetical protein
MLQPPAAKNPKRTADRAAQRQAATHQPPAAKNHARTAATAAHKDAATPQPPAAKNPERTATRAAQTEAATHQPPAAKQPARTAARANARIVADEEASHAGLHNIASWARAKRLLASFNKRCALFFQALVCCALCGACKVGGCNSFHKFKAVPAFGDVPPYALANIGMEQCTVHEDGKWWLCPVCQADRTRRQRYEVRISSEYADLLFAAEPLEVCTLSLLDVCVEFSKRWYGFTHGTIMPSTILSSPLITWAKTDAAVNMPLAVQQLLAHNMQSNPIFQAYKCVLERPGKAFKHDCVY